MVNNCYDDMFRNMHLAIETWRTYAAQGMDAGGEGQTAAAAYGDGLNVLAQMSQMCMTSGFHMWQRWAEIYWKYALDLLHTLQVMSTDPERRGQAQGTLIDMLRAYVREMAELPAHESRQFLAELEKLAGQAWPTATGGQEGTYQRYWRTKS